MIGRVPRSRAGVPHSRPRWFENGDRAALRARSPRSPGRFPVPVRALGVRFVNAQRSTSRPLQRAPCRPALSPSPAALVWERGMGPVTRPFAAFSPPLLAPCQARVTGTAPAFETPTGSAPPARAPEGFKSFGRFKSFGDFKPFGSRFKPLEALFPIPCSRMKGCDCPLRVLCLLRGMLLRVDSFCHGM